MSVCSPWTKGRKRNPALSGAEGQVSGWWLGMFCIHPAKLRHVREGSHEEEPYPISWVHNQEVIRCVAGRRENELPVDVVEVVSDECRWSVGGVLVEGKGVLVDPLKSSFQMPIIR